MLLRFSLFALIAAAAFAQTDNPFNKPPADVDEALRARITEFYGLHVKGEFRKAEALVAEDTKDFYYTHNKPKYLSFEIARIDYSKEFTQAKATVLCEQIVMFPGFTDKPMKIPTPSTWKLEDGKWYWYMDPDTFRDSPMGKMTAGKTPAPGSAPPPAFSVAAIPTTADFVLKQVKVDKGSVSLKAGESAQVTIANGAPGIMNISVTGKAAGVEGKLDRNSLKSGEQAKLTILAGTGAKSGVLTIVVEQTSEYIPIQIEVTK